MEQQYCQPKRFEGKFTPPWRGGTQAEAAKALGIAQSHMPDLIRGKRGKSSLDMLITLAARTS